MFSLLAADKNERDPTDMEIITFPTPVDSGCLITSSSREFSRAVLN